TKLVRRIIQPAKTYVNIRVNKSQGEFRIIRLEEMKQTELFAEDAKKWGVHCCVLDFAAMKYGVLVIMFTFILSVYLQGERFARDPSPTHQNSQKPEAQTTTRGVKAIGQQAPATKGNGVNSKVGSYLRRLFSPENLPSIGLLVAGIVGIIVAIGTLNHMRESSEMQLRAYVVAELGY